MTMQGYRDQCTRMSDSGYFYDNSFRRCYPDPYRGRDCSTGANFALIDAEYAGVNACGTSFSLAEDCFHAVRPPIFSDHFGGDLPGTFISYADAQAQLCWGFRGSNWGMHEDSIGDGHVETIWGNGALSFGFHSHTTGVGFDANGINNHHLEWFAIPPWFMGELQIMWGADIDWAWLTHVAQWEADVTRNPLKFGQHGPLIQTLNDLLRMKGYIKRTGNRYGVDTRDGVVHVKSHFHTKNRSGKKFGGDAAAVLLRGK